MRIRKISLENFRQFKKQKFEFSSKTNLLLGPNKSGKTTILEAIVLLSTAASFRAEKISEMIKWGKEIANLQIQLGDKNNLQIMVSSGQIQGKRIPKKKFLINGVAKKKKDFVGRLLTVLFRPADINIVTGSPTRRRDFFDRVLLQVDWEYARSLTAYRKALKNRNRVLEGIREGKEEKNSLFFWNQSLDKNGEIIFRMRDEFADFINHLWPSGLRFVYQENRFLMDANLNKEIEMGMTLSGPCRDDFYLEKNKRNLAAYGSRSEQRLAILNLKLAELQFLIEKAGEIPVLLLDDIFSELDKEFRERVLAIVSGQQTIITSAEPELIKKEFLDKMKVIKL